MEVQVGVGHAYPYRPEEPMPVYSRRRTNPPTEYFATYERTGEVSHVGLVLALSSYCDKVMSDVWADFYYAVVWNPETGSPSNVPLSNSEFGGDKEAEVDATPEVRAAYDAYLAEKARKDREAERLRQCEAARLRLLIPVVGCPARVMKGRNVKIGTEGLITWKGTNGYGDRVGIKDAAGTVQYTAITNVVRTGVELLDGEDWLSAERRLTVIPPSKWNTVRVVKGAEAGKVGLVFYVNGTRLGIATTDRKVGGRYADVVWADALDVAVTSEELSEEPAFTNVAVPPATAGDPVPF